MNRVSLVPALTLAACNPADPAASKAAPEPETTTPAGAEVDVKFPPHVEEGRVELEGTGGELAGKRFAGAPVEAGYSKQYQQVYTQTQPFAEGEAALTYTVLPAITTLAPGVHAEVEEGFKVYGMGGGHNDTSMFSGAVEVVRADAAAGAFDFVYVGTLDRDGQETPVQGGLNVVVPVGN